MDRDGWSARTDNIVVVDPGRRRLRWIPRDLWSTTVGDRINVAFARGGHEGLVAALAEHRIWAQDSICLRREATERALEDVVVTVPVARPLSFWYPLSPQSPIEDGRKLVEFRPPSATLTGERIHQWIGARSEPRPVWYPDFRRISRQQVFVRCLLDQGFDFRTVLANPELVRISSPQAMADVACVRKTWRFEMLRDTVNASIDGKAVLVRRRFGHRSTRALQRLARRSGTVLWRRPAR